MSKARLIDGKTFAARLRRTVADAVTWLGTEHNLVPGLAVVLVGDDPASQIYTRNKIKQTADVGMASLHERLPADTCQIEVLNKIAILNEDRSVNGILVQLPLPDQIHPDTVIDQIDPAKDVDGFHLLNAGKLVTGRPDLTPCTPQGCLLLLKETLGDLEGAEVVIVGRSNIVGKPVAQLLLQENCTVTVAHSRTRNLAELCRRSDILVAAVGRPEMIRGTWIKPGATVIDVGINRIAGSNNTTRLVGDVSFDEAVEIAGAITPVPGGVGPMTIACLLANCVRATCYQHGLPAPDLSSSVA
ncbi:MAG: Bifunctional protein FolD protein [Alphaproteobacteria bacterium MarineAlpha9_Bin6]|nr:MAG: Bifunctional protein FolD protein [Alphaproteobacteria bacterium MarineAlpha9_Bin6]